MNDALMLLEALDSLEPVNGKVSVNQLDLAEALGWSRDAVGRVLDDCEARGDLENVGRLGSSDLSFRLIKEGPVWVSLKAKPRCVWCNKPFEQTTPNNRLCSDECKRLRANSQNRARYQRKDRFCIRCKESRRVQRSFWCNECQEIVTTDWSILYPQFSRLELLRRNRQLRQYSIDLYDYYDLYQSQNEHCALCKKPAELWLSVDHNHGCCPLGRSCGKCIRGLLHVTCNLGLGRMEKILASGIRYLADTGSIAETEMQSIAEIIMRYRSNDPVILKN